MAQVPEQGEHDRKEDKWTGTPWEGPVCHMLAAYREQLIILPSFWVLNSESIDMKRQMRITGSALLKKVVTTGHMEKPGLDHR